MNTFDDKIQETTELYPLKADKIEILQVMDLLFQQSKIVARQQEQQ